LSDKKRVAVLVSGGGTNLQAIFDAEDSGIIKSAKVVLVISNVSGAYALERAKARGVETETIRRKDLGGDQAAFEAKLTKTLEAHNIDLIVLAGFLSILSGDFSKRFDHRVINVHPALIPSFSGKGYYGLRVHEEALKYGVKVSGATVHYANEVCDGGEIIMQKAIDVLPGDTPEILQRRIMEQCEWYLLPRAIELICSKEN
jgi:phosphoribosylglycinamide formyltransferase 1